MLPPAEAPLQTRGLSLDRRGRRVLSDVDTDFPSEAVTAVVGPSGAGKTSLLRCLNRLEDPDEGRILLDGRDVRELEPTEVRKRVGMIFQTPVLLPGGVRANLAYGLGDVDDAVLENALDAAGLPTAFLERESPALSVGQAQRVCIARALVREPEVLLMDEPTSALDKSASATIESLLGALTARGLGVVLVTHDFEQAKRTAERGYLLVEGRVVAEGSPDALEAHWPESAS